MTYELARQLKDAGFPVRHCEYANTYNESGLGECAYCEQPAFIIGRGHYIIPTLSELIEACPEFRHLERGDEETAWKWAAFTAYSPEKYAHLEQNCLSVAGETPEEAVANLWLSLNTKS